MGIRRRFSKVKNVQRANRIKRRNGGSHKVAPVPQSKVEVWDPSKTLKENYKAAKIAYDINANPKILDKRPELEVHDDGLNSQKDLEFFKELRIKQGGEEIGENSKQKFLFKKSMESVKQIKKRHAKINKDDGLIVRRLIKKYGEDVAKMRRDIKINKNQWTEAECKQKIKAYNQRFGDKEITFKVERTKSKKELLKEQEF